MMAGLGLRLLLGVSRGAPRDIRRVESAARFRAHVERRLRRSSRDGVPFAVLAFEVGSLSRRDAPAFQTVELIRARVRSTDVLGWLDASTLGLLLLHVGEADALELAEELCDALAARTPTPPRCIIYPHPPPVFRRRPMRFPGGPVGRAETV